VKKINIILSTNFYPIEGGIQTYMYQLAEHWQKGETIVLCDQEKDEPLSMDEPFRIERVSKGMVSYPKAIYSIFRTLCSFPSITRLKFLAILFVNRSFVCRYSRRISCFLELVSNNYKQIDLIQCSTTIPNAAIGLFAKLLYKIPVITYVHGSELLILHKKRTTRMLQRFVLRNSDFVIANSAYTYSLLASYHLENDKTMIVNLGADLSKFYPMKPDPSIRKSMGVSQNAFVLLTISHLVSRKGHDMVIRALPKIVKSHPETVYVIAGQGPNEENLRKLVKELGVENNVHFTGFLQESQLNSFMNACDLFVMPNRDEDGDIEGFGIVFIEANACRKPVIAGRSGGAVDAVIHGKTGYLVDPLDEDKIASSVVSLIENPELRKNMGDQGFLRSTEEFNWAAVTHRIYSRIESVIH